jgi:pyruvate/2-oxoglutarate dehydrogenase complex dihydrolipoamide acyltransferase (E2) component
MRSRIWSATCAAIVLGVSVGILAQDAPAPPSASQSAAAKKITVTGCVAKAQQAQAPTGTAGSPGAAASSKETFVLSGAAMSSNAATGTAGAAAPSATAIASEYKLDAADAKLTPHVGHKVEITGTVEEPKGGTQPPAASAANAPTLKVDDLKMVAPSCK